MSGDSKNKNKTLENDNDVMAFLESIDHEKRKSDSFKALRLLTEVTKTKPKMWGGSIVGFGKYHYKYESGREGDMCKSGFSPRKTALTFYVMSGFPRKEELMQKLGKYKTGKACLYIKKWEDIDESILRKIIDEDWKYMTQKYG